MFSHWNAKVAFGQCALLRHTTAQECDMTPTKTARRPAAAAAARANQRPLDVARLVRGAHAGDAEAWNGIIDRYSGLVWAIARGHRLGAADAADVEARMSAPPTEQRPSDSGRG
jgi:hypothetical protein